MLDNHAAHRGLDAEERQLVISQLPPGLITRGMSQDWGPPRHCKTSSSTSSKRQECMKWNRILPSQRTNIAATCYNLRHFGKGIMSEIFCAPKRHDSNDAGYISKATGRVAARPQDSDLAQRAR